MTCVVCGGEIRDGQEVIFSENVHGYCYDVNDNFRIGWSAMRIENKKTGGVVVPELNHEGYKTGKFKTLSDDEVRAKVSLYDNKKKKGKN